MDLAGELAPSNRGRPTPRIIATWHDESHLNRYIIDRTDVRILPPSFCFPVEWDGNYPELIWLRKKTDVIDEAAFKGWGRTSALPVSPDCGELLGGRFTA